MRELPSREAGRGGARRSHVELAVLLFSVLVALFAAAGILRGGWPHNHDGLSAFERTEWFRRAFLAGDPFPTWTPFCFNGHGSPGPFFYHRLFYTLSGALAAAGASAVAAVAAGVVVFLVVGALGMARLGKDLGWPLWLRLAAAALLVLAPYTYTDWLVRGAMAELAAGMLVPWLFIYSHRVMRGERVRAALGAVWALMFYAHIVVWLYATIVLGIAFGAALARERRHGWHAPVLSNLLWTGLTAAPAVGIYALAIRRLGRHFSLDRLRVYLPTESLVLPKRYLSLPVFRWGEQWQGFSVEIGRAALVGILVLLPLALRARGPMAWRAVALTGATALVCFALQLEPAASFYRLVPLADVIQFPWRLLTFITPAVVALLCELAASVTRARGRRLGVVAAGAVISAVVACQVAFAVRAQRIRYPWFTRGEIESALADLDGPWSGGEFLVKGIAAVPPRAPFLALEGCTLRSSAPAGDLSRPFHFTRLELEVAAPARCALRFSQFATPFVGVGGVAPGGVRRADDGTLEVVLGPGLHRVSIWRRGVLAALFADIGLASEGAGRGQ